MHLGGGITLVGVFSIECDSFYMGNISGVGNTEGQCSFEAAIVKKVGL